jgi:hypothetical protein
MHRPRAAVHFPAIPFNSERKPVPIHRRALHRDAITPPSPRAKTPFPSAIASIPARKYSGRIFLDNPQTKP